MHHLNDLLWLALIFGLSYALIAWARDRNRAAIWLARAAQGHPRVVLAIIGVTYTAVVLQWSARNGRVAMDPQWDDVGYLLDAQRRLTIFDWQAYSK